VKDVEGKLVTVFAVAGGFGAGWSKRGMRFYVALVGGGIILTGSIFNYKNFEL
jgi:hypothetical protein